MVAGNEVFAGGRNVEAVIVLNMCKGRTPPSPFCASLN